MTIPGDQRTTDVSRPTRRAGRTFAWVLGVALLALAIVAAFRAGIRLPEVWARLDAAPNWQLVLLPVLIAITPLFTAWGFRILTQRYALVGRLEMVSLISAAWLLNFLPLSPGMFGRIAYHRTVNGIAIKGSAMTIIWANILSVIAGVVLLAMVSAASLFLRGDDPRFALLAASPIAVMVALAWHARRARPKPDPEVWRTVAALAVRYSELHIWAARVWVAFAITGQPLTWGGALALASFGTLASLFPLAPNGLGVREWAIGLIAPLLPLSVAYTAGLTTASGLAAELVHRSVEIAVAIPVGLIGAAGVARRLRRAGSNAGTAIAN